MNDLPGKLRFDPVVGERLYGNHRKNSGSSSERDLMFAILADAIDCYWKYSGARDGRSIKLFQDARRWIFTDDDDGEAFSFVNVCDALSLDPAYIRRGVAQAEQRQREVFRAKESERSRPNRVKRNLKSSTRWKVSSRPVRG